jgi:signal peptidase II
VSDVAERAAAARLTRVALAVGLIVAIDQLTKSLAVAHLTRGEAVDVIGSWVRFDLTSNSGGSFSILQGSTALLAIGAIAATLYLVHLVRSTDDRVTVVALTLLLSGAVGNLSDRMLRAPDVLRGEVIDFIRIPRWPTFNVADMCVTFGGVLLAVRVLMGEREARGVTSASSGEPSTSTGPIDE